MTTRLSKIARLPAKTREQLNRRLHNGELGRTILPWVNALPRTKKVLAEIFNNKPITHQNLSEWRATGYQDWLFHQQRLDWFSRLEEEDKEISKHDGCGDTYEAMSRFFLFEIGQAMRDAQKIKNPDARWERLERLTDKFARLQNSYNWSRRCQLEYDQYNNQFESEEESEENEPPDGNDDLLETGDRARPGRSETRPRVSPLRGSSSESPVPPHTQDVRREAHRTAAEAAALPEPERQESGALQDAPRTSKAEVPCASIPDCGSPLPLSDLNSSTPELFSSQTPNCPQLTSDLPTPSSELRTPNCQPIPTPPPTTPINPAYRITPQIIQETNAIRKTRNLYTRTRGRGFTCIEG